MDSSGSGSSSATTLGYRPAITTTLPSAASAETTAHTRRYQSMGSLRHTQ